MQTSANSHETTITLDQSTLHITLQGVVGVAVVAQLFEKINYLLAEQLEGITVDPSAAKGFDTTSIQLLVALIEHSKAQGITYQWLNTSELLNEVAGLLGLTSKLELAA